jgi:hypothetical protein
VAAGDDSNVFPTCQANDSDCPSVYEQLPLPSIHRFGDSQHQSESRVLSQVSESIFKVVAVESQASTACQSVNTSLTSQTLNQIFEIVWGWTNTIGARPKNNFPDIPNIDNDFLVGRNSLSSKNMSVSHHLAAE